MRAAQERGKSDRHRLRWAALPGPVVVGLLCLGATCTPVEPVGPVAPPPQLSRQVSYARVGQPDASGTALAVEARVEWLGDGLPETGEPLDAYAHLILTPGSPRIIRSTTERLRAARLQLLPGDGPLEGENLERWALPVGAVTGLALRFPDATGRLLIHVTHGEGPKIQLRVGSEGEAEGRTVREEVVLERLDLEGQRVRLLLPSPVPGEEGGVEVTLRIAPPGPKDTWHAAALERATKSLSAERPAPPQSPVARSSTVQALRMPARHREALMFLAREAGAPNTLSYALTATPERLGKLAPEAATWLEHLPEAQMPQLGWELEKWMLLQLAALSRRAESSAVGGFLVGRLGQVGASPSILRELVREASSLEELEQMVVEENREALLDDMAATRVRAFDWLTQVGEAPEGYDPLATADEREAALRGADGDE